MRQVTYFESVRRQATKAVPCAVCGKTVHRQRTFTMTVNPYNRDPETGEPRTHAQIWTALGEKVREWAALPESHAAHHP